MSLEDIAVLAAKSAVVAGLGLVLARVVAKRAADRVVMLRSAVVLTLALPLMTALLPVLEWAVLPAERIAAVAAEPIWAGRIDTGAGYAVSGVIERPGPEVWIALGWLAVSAALGLRLALGLVTLMRWSEGARAPRFKAWTAALETLAGKKGPRLLVSDRAAGPLSWGLPPGAILIDKASEARPETAPAVIAHELAHLKRGDWAFLMLSRLMVAMFWFNPLCWRLHAELVARSEEAADAEAVRSVDRATYAHALVALALQPGAGAPLLPASGMAASPKDLKERITSLMQPTARRRPVTLALSLVALAAVATPIAALEIARRDPPAAPEAPAAPHAPGVTPVMAALGVQPVAPLPAQPPARRLRRLRLRRPRAGRFTSAPTTTRRKPRPRARPPIRPAKPAAPCASRAASLPKRRAAWPRSMSGTPRGPARRPSRSASTPRPRLNTLASPPRRPVSRRPAPWQRPASRWRAGPIRCAKAPTRCARRPAACATRTTGPK